MTPVDDVVHIYTNVSLCLNRQTLPQSLCPRISKFLMANSTCV